MSEHDSVEDHLAPKGCIIVYNVLGIMNREIPRACILGLLCSPTLMVDCLNGVDVRQVF